MKKRYGLIGFPLQHSFSPAYFAEKFVREGITNAQYMALPIEHIYHLPDLLFKYPNLVGLNVTIPFKQAVIPLLDALTPVAEAIGAVNTIAITEKGLIGTNTDAFGFEQSLKPWLQLENAPKSALVLGSGGAAAAVRFVLTQIGMTWHTVSRQSQGDIMSYTDANQYLISRSEPVLVVNTTPLGMHPEVDAMPPIDMAALHATDFVFDLIYNPEQTLLLQRAAARGATIQNGLEMLHLQAEKAWQFWNEHSS